VKDLKKVSMRINSANGYSTNSKSKNSNLNSKTCFKGYEQLSIAYDTLQALPYRAKYYEALHSNNYSKVQDGMKDIKRILERVISMSVNKRGGMTKISVDKNEVVLFSKSEYRVNKPVGTILLENPKGTNEFKIKYIDHEMDNACFIELSSKGNGSNVTTGKLI